MKRSYLLIVLLLVSCTQQQNPSANSNLESKVATLERKVDDLKPGLGEIMGVIQQHHAKLYYSGMKENWDLAKYQLGEIQEGLDDVVKYYPKFKEVKTPITDLIPSMIKPGLDMVGGAIEHKNKAEFVKAFKTLSVSCTSCHQAAEHPFIKIRVPSEGMFSNQDFKK